VGKPENLLKQARDNPASLSFREFETLMRVSGWQFKRQKGSHRLWFSPAEYRLPVQKSGSRAKSYQVRQFLSQYDKEHSDGG
jgi:predicted RNA binding protein YcfA (HicA-like mRNA interferase family)